MRLRSFVVVGLVVAAVLALVVAPYASGEPDGLERVATDEGFAVTGGDDDGYDAPVARLLGVGACFAVASGAVVLVRRRRPG